MILDDKEFTTTHTILKNTDIKHYLSEEEKLELDVILDKIRLGRLRDNRKSTNTYIVVNTDEKYAKKILNEIQKHEFYKRY